MRKYETPIIELLKFFSDEEIAAENVSAGGDTFGDDFGDGDLDLDL